MTAENTISNQKDYFLEHPPMQPKAEIGAYVESKGILVPQRFENLEEAIASGKPFIIRSEHPQDYDGVSGLMESLVITKGNIERSQKIIEQIGTEINWNDETSSYNNKYQIINKIGKATQSEIENDINKLSESSVKEFCRLKRLDGDSFKSKITFSYWEFIDGVNQTIVADSSIEGRYHVFSSRRNPESTSYFTYEKGVVFNNKTGIGFDYLDQDAASEVVFKNLEDTPSEAVKFYASLRSLDRFDPNNVPHIECVVKDGKRYFLQYLKGRDFVSSKFELTRELEEDEFEAKFVRGATPPGGAIYKTNIWYSNCGFEIDLTNEEASFDFGMNQVFSEIMTKKRKIQFMHDPNFSFFISKAAGGHPLKSKIFNAEVSVFIDWKQFNIMIFGQLTEEEFMNKNKNIDLSSFTANIFVESDGRRAIIKRVN
jgi:hypothetical protein